MPAAKDTSMPTVSLTLTGPAGAETTELASLPLAVDRAIAARRQRPEVGLRFELGDGVHRLARTLVLPAELSGRVDEPTVFAAMPGATPTVSGSWPVTGAWRPLGDGVWMVELDRPGGGIDAADGLRIDQLWLDDQRQVRARYPDHDASVAPFFGVAADALSPDRVRGWADPQDAEVHAMHRYRWGSVFTTIESVDENGAVTLAPLTGNNRVIDPDPTELHPSLRYVENVFDELDAPHEWFHDHRHGRLYFIPPEGVDPHDHLIEATAVTDLISVTGSSGGPVHDVRFDGLRFTHSARTVMAATERILRSDWALARAGAVVLEHTARVTVAGCDFTDLGGNGVMISGDNESITVTGCLFADLGGSAVHLAGRLEAARSPVVGYYDSLALDQIDRRPGPASAAHPRDCTIHDNLITAIGVTDKQAAGVGIDIAARITVSHNSIYQVPRAGINIGTGNFGGHLIEHNDVFDTVLESNDHGSFNSWGRDRYWHPDLHEMRQRVADEPGLAFLDAVEPVIMRRNRWRTDDGFDVDLDDGSSNYLIHENLMLRGGLKLREGFGRIVTNNIILNNGLHPHVSFPASGDVFAHNIVMGPYQPIGVDEWSPDHDHNLFTSDHALADARALGSDTHSISGDPHFIDPDAGDFRIADTSAALAIGFRPFPHEFGVRSPRLRQLARTPQIPELISRTDADPTATHPFLGATIKSVDTLAEQSAVGSDDSGALVVEVAAGSEAAAAGLRAWDVVKTVEVGGTTFPVHDAPTLLVLRASHAWLGQLPLSVLRDHRMIEIRLPYDDAR